MERRLYSIREAHEILNISRAKFYTLISANQIETVKVGSRRLVPREAIDEFIGRLKVVHVASPERRSRSA